MEREIFFSGIGGQGVQLAARTLAVAAMKAGLHVLMFGTYGGSMRGGHTDATVIVGQQPLIAPPVVDKAWAALMMHHHSWKVLAPKIRSGGPVLIDSRVFRGEVVRDGPLLEVDAATIATDAGLAKAASMVALGAFAAATEIVDLDVLGQAAREVLPPYRAQFAEANVRALEIGHALFPEPVAPAWHEQGVLA